MGSYGYKPSDPDSAKQRTYQVRSTVCLGIFASLVNARHRRPDPSDPRLEKPEAAESGHGQ